MQISELVGETLSHVDAGEEQIMLTTESGRIIRIYHSQDCCENVEVEDTEGNWHELVGKVIVEASEEVKQDGDPPPKNPDSWTRTTLRFKAGDSTVISRWLGESNGYYSESVDIEELARDSKA